MTCFSEVALQLNMHTRVSPVVAGVHVVCGHELTRCHRFGKSIRCSRGHQNILCRRRLPRVSTGCDGLQRAFVARRFSTFISYPTGIAYHPGSIGHNPEAFSNTHAHMTIQGIDTCFLDGASHTNLILCSSSFRSGWL